MDDRDQRKQIPLRLSPSLWEDLHAWAENDFRSLNGQIEFLLTECVRKQRRNGGNYINGEPVSPPSDKGLRD